MFRFFAVAFWVLSFLGFSTPLFAAGSFTARQSDAMESMAAKWERDSLTLLVLPPTSDPDDPNIGACADVVAKTEWLGVAKGLMRAAQDIRRSVGRKPPDKIYVWPSNDERGTAALFDMVRPDPLHCGEGIGWPCPWSQQTTPASQ